MNHPKTILAAAILLCLFAGILYFFRSNSVGNIDRILSADSYTVNFNSCGCFGCGSGTLKIIKGRHGTSAMFLVYKQDSLKTFVEKQRDVTWNANKERILRTLFIKGIRYKDRNGCTTVTDYTLESFPFSIKWTDGDCAYGDTLTNLLN